MIDLAAHHLNLVQNVIERAMPGADLIAFGSRTNGNAKPFSDLDLAVLNDAQYSDLQWLNAKDWLDESDLPIRVDLLRWSRTDEKFRDSIRASNKRLVTQPA